MAAGKEVERERDTAATEMRSAVGRRRHQPDR